MSLQIWLPLNGSLENQGVANAPLMGSYTPTYSEDSLFGKSFSCKSAVKYNAKGIIKSTEYTLTTWIKSVSTTGWWLAISLKYSNGTQTTNNLYNAPNGRFKFEYVPEQNIYCDVSQWHHLAFVVKGNQMISYLDGEQYNIYNFTNEERILDYLQIGNANADMWLNDVRLYNNALSPKEVKEIASGLLIHYPMRDMYIEELDNLTAAPTVKKDYVNSTWSASLHPGAKEVNGWSVGYNGGVPTPETGYHAYWKVIDDIPTMVMINKNSEFSKKGRWLGVSSSSSASLTAAIMASKIYTISFDAKTDTTGTKVTGGLYSRLVGASSNAFNDNQFAFYPTDEWKRYSITVIPNQNIDPTKWSSVYFYGHTGAEGIVYIRNPQIIAGESSVYIGDQVTSGGLCIDSSGYYNNASTVAGKVTYSDDSPRGYGCFKFNGSSYLRTENILTPQRHTISVWVNYHERGKHLVDWRDSNGNGLQPIYFGADGRIQYWTSAGTSGYFNYVIPMDEWHHIVLACDGATVKLYVDGILRGSQATAIAADKRPITIGARCNAANIIKAEIADFRVYTTELSADEILKLYNVPIWIDENQTLGAIGFTETETSSNRFEKSGKVDTREINTVLYNGKVKTKFLNDGSAWARIHYLDLSSNKTCFTAAEVDYCVDKDNRFSIMKDIDKFKGAEQLPSGYTKLEYIESTGTQHIDTGYYWTKENIKIIFDGMVTSNGSSQSLFGVEEYIEASGNNRNFSGIPHGANGSFGIYIGNGNQGTVACGLNTRFNLTLQTTADKKLTALLNGVVKISNKTYTNSVLAKTGAYLTSSASTTVGNFFLFANHNSNRGSTNAATQQVGGMRLYRFQMEDGNDVVRSFVPCKSPSGEIGLYDGVTKQFFTNAGTGVFIAGPEMLNSDVPNTGHYEFMLTYPSKSKDLYNRWKQTISPNVLAEKTTTGTGYEAIHSDFTSHLAPLRKTVSGSSVYSCNLSNNWWAPIGQTGLFSGTGIPAADGSTQLSTELWVRIDHLDYNTLNELFTNENTKVKIYDNHILAKHIIEI